MANVNDLIFVINNSQKKGETPTAMPCLKDKKGWAVQNGYRILEGQEAAEARAAYLAAQSAPPAPTMVKPDTGGGDATQTGGDGNNDAANTVKPEKKK